jgi:hypothetical protein
MFTSVGRSAPSTELIAAHRKIRGRVQWTPWERLTMGLAARLPPAWRTAVLLVQLATILRWRQAGVAAPLSNAACRARSSRLERRRR